MRLARQGGGKPFFEDSTRTRSSGAAETHSRLVQCSVINAGDGSHEHPTQGWLDVFTIRETCQAQERKIADWHVASVGVEMTYVLRNNLSIAMGYGQQLRRAPGATNKGDQFDIAIALGF